MLPKHARILLVDDHQIVLDSLRLLLATIEHIEVIGTLNDCRRVASFLAKQEVDIVICDLHMPHMTGIELTVHLRQRYPAIKVMLLTMAEDGASIREAVRAGIHGYVLKRAGRDELEKAVNSLIRDKKYFSDEILDKLAAIAPSMADAYDPLAFLTDREIDVLKLIAAEYSTNEIAEKLFISVPTVETHRRHLMQKLGVKSVVGMVKFAIKHGMVA